MKRKSRSGRTFHELLDERSVFFPVFVRYEVVVYGFCDVWLEKENLLRLGHLVPAKP